MQMPVVNGEGLQILNYQIGGEYKPHYDYFPPDQPGSAQHIAIGGQRVATLIIYLNEVEEGGATIFPELGLTVTPVQGSAVYFSYSNSKKPARPADLSRRQSRDQGREMDRHQVDAAARVSVGLSLRLV
ncbi:2OG-Fe(II) oxygenase [Undibacterium arcticum]